MHDPIKVYLYGHYDSRGGTTAIDASSRQIADQAYVQTFGMTDAELDEIFQDPMNIAPEDKGKTFRQLTAEQDFLYEATLVDPPDAGDDEDIDGDFGEVWQSVDDSTVLRFVPGSLVYDADNDPRWFHPSAPMSDTIATMTTPTGSLVGPILAGTMTHTASC